MATQETHLNDLAFQSRAEVLSDQRGEICRKWGMDASAMLSIISYMSCQLPVTSCSKSERLSQFCPSLKYVDRFD